MNNVQIVMGILIVTASMFVGVIAAMMGVIQVVLNQLDYAAYTRVMKGIIAAGRKSLIIWSLLLIPLGAAVVTLFLLRSETESAAFGWIAIGLVLFIAGPILVSRFGNEPWYDRIMGWSPDAPDANWKMERLRWFKLNVARFTIGALSCLAFAAALASYQ